MVSTLYKTRHYYRGYHTKEDEVGVGYTHIRHGIDRRSLRNFSPKTFKGRDNLEDFVVGGKTNLNPPQSGNNVNNFQNSVSSSQKTHYF